ncbi:MAG: glycosyltransferase [Clostridium perfringens]|nr:glycosyltransferase [Clostridium perfringens]
MKILFVACYSPFINNSASIETLMYLNNISKENEVHLLTVDFPKESIYYDEEVLSLLDENIIIYKIGMGKVFNKLMPKKEKSNNLNTSKNIFLLKRVKNKVIFPDIYYYWSIKSSNFGKRLMRKEKFNLIFSMHEPPSSHLCALRIKKSFKNIPWILYWSDPWIKDISRKNIGIIRKYIEKKQEKLVVNLGDKHIFVTKENKEYFKNQYNLEEKNLFLINRGYDEELYKRLREEDKPKLLKKDKINIVYTGDIIEKIRDIKPFIEGLKILKNTNIELFNKLNILFFGNIDGNSIKEELRSFENVKFSKRIDFKEALKYIIHSDILLVFGNKTSMQIPAKIYDYLGSFSPILIIKGNEHDKIEELVKGIEKCFITKNNSYEIIKSLEEVVKVINTGKKFKSEEKYSCNNIYKKLNNIFIL